MHCLTKTGELKDILLAAKLARYLNEETESLLVLKILVKEYLNNCKWNEARELLGNHPKLVVCLFNLYLNIILKHPNCYYLIFLF